MGRQALILSSVESPNPESHCWGQPREKWLFHICANRYLQGPTLWPDPRRWAHHVLQEKVRPAELSPLWPYFLAEAQEGSPAVSIVGCFMSGKGGGAHRDLRSAVPWDCVTKCVLQVGSDERGFPSARQIQRGNADA